MVSLNSRVEWESFSIDDWLDQHQILKSIIESYNFFSFHQIYHSSTPLHQHSLVETLNILLTLTTDKNILTCTYFSLLFYRKDNISKQISDSLPPHTYNMIQQYYYLENILKTVTIVASSYKEQIRKMLLATVDDPRIVVIMLSKVLAILRHPFDYDESYMTSLAKISLEIFAPIAHRLGIGQIKWEIEDHAFHLLFPSSYYELAEKLAQSRNEREAFIEGVKIEVTSLLESQNVQSMVTGRSKNFYSIWKKMTKKNKVLSQIFDLNAIRIIVDSIQDCYRTLGMIHTQWGYLSEEFDDYIANPKINGYQSIHTAVFGPQQKIVEVQIRTLAMHQSAELGIAAHWMYKDGASQQLSYQNKLETLRNFLQRADISSNELFEKAKDEIFGDRVYVFTPKGDVYDLPKGSTALDLAYHIHSDLGHHCSGAKIQGKMISLTEPLSTGLVVEISTSPRCQPSRDWLNPHYGYIKTTRARQRITHWFRSLDRGRLVNEGKIYLEKQIKRLGIQISFSVDDLVQKFNFKWKDDFYYAIAIGDLKVSRVFESLELSRKNCEASHISTYKDILPVKKEKQPKKIMHHEVSFGYFNGDAVKYDYAACCEPIFPQPIVGLITRARGLIVHRSDCVNLKFINQVHDRTMFAKWSCLMHDEIMEPIFLKMTTIDQCNLNDSLNTIRHVLLDFDIAMNQLKNKSDQKNEIIVMFEVKSLTQLNELIERLYKLNSIIKVERMLTVER
jgi:GTP pyrophosphokinase